VVRLRVVAVLLGWLLLRRINGRSLPGGRGRSRVRDGLGQRDVVVDVDHGLHE